MLKAPSFVNEITSFLRQELECESPTPQGDAAPISPSSGTPSMSGQGVTQRCLEQKFFPALKLLPVTNSNKRSCLWQVSVLLSKTHFAEQFFICSCLFTAQPCSPQALQREIWVGKEFPPLFLLQPWPAGTYMDSQSCTLLSSYAAIKKPSRCEFLSGVSCKEMKKGSLEDVPQVYIGVLCCLRVSY